MKFKIFFIFSILVILITLTGCMNSQENDKNFKWLNELEEEQSVPLQQIITLGKNYVSFDSNGKYRFIDTNGEIIESQQYYNLDLLKVNDNDSMTVKMTRYYGNYIVNISQNGIMNWRIGSYGQILETHVNEHNIMVLAQKNNLNDYYIDVINNEGKVTLSQQIENYESLEYVNENSMYYITAITTDTLKYDSVLKRLDLEGNQKDILSARDIDFQMTTTDDDLIFKIKTRFGEEYFQLVNLDGKLVQKTDSYTELKMLHYNEKLGRILASYKAGSVQKKFIILDNHLNVIKQSDEIITVNYTDGYEENSFYVTSNLSETNRQLQVYDYNLKLLFEYSIDATSNIVYHDDEQTLLTEIVDSQQYVMKLDQNGDEVFRKPIDGQINHVIVIGNEYYLIKEDSDFSSSYYLTKLNKSGEIVYERGSYDSLSLLQTSIKNTVILDYNYLGNSQMIIIESNDKIKNIDLIGYEYINDEETKIYYKESGKDSIKYLIVKRFPFYY